MQLRYLDMETYRRKSHFAYFNSLAYPYVGLTVNVDITEFLKEIKEKGLPFFLSICYCVSRAANGVPEFRQRILKGRIGEFDHCRTSHTVALEDGTYCYCTLDDSLPFEEYLAFGAAAQEEAKKKGSIYTSLIQPVPMPADSNPRITWGKYFRQGEQVLLPVSVLCHHALVDGAHIAEFYRLLAQELKKIG